MERDETAVPLFHQDSSTTGSANQFASHVRHLRAVSLFIPRVFALRLWSVAVGMHISVKTLTGNSVAIDIKSRKNTLNWMPE